MLLRILSDLHIEFEDFVIPSQETDKQTTLILAGDIGLTYNQKQLTKLGQFLVDCSTRFQRAIYILGNHEHYHGIIENTYCIVNQLIRDLGICNVFLLENETVIFDDVAFVCATLWTDYQNGSPLKMSYAAGALNDHQLIKTTGGYKYFEPVDALALCVQSKQYIFNEAKKQKQLGNKVVIVVHHGVSYKSIHPMYHGSSINTAFTSDLDNDVLDADPLLVIHGHTHQCFDYMIGNTRVIVNPKGYPNETNSFNPLLTVEI